MAVGQRPQKIGEFGVAMLIDEPRHGITERRPHGSPTRDKAGLPRTKAKAKRCHSGGTPHMEGIGKQRRLTRIFPGLIRVLGKRRFGPAQVDRQRDL